MESAVKLGLEGKVALVVGASQGIGAACAKELAGEGVSVMLAARSKPVIEGFMRDVPKGHFASVAVDMTTPASGQAAVDATIAAFGQIDILIISVGAAQGGLFWDIPDAQWDEAFALKFMGMVRLMRAAAPIMKAQGSGSIVTVVGNTGKQPHPRLLPGSAANAACLAVTAGLAQELASDGVSVTAVNPGPTRTGRWDTLMERLAKASGNTPAQEEAAQLALSPSGRINEPEEVAKIVILLASGAAPLLTGTSVTMDGCATKGLI